MLLLLLACTDAPTDTAKADTAVDSATDSAETGEPEDTDWPHGDPETCGYEAAPDLDPDPTVVEVDLTASAFAWDPGTGIPLTDGVAFNGTVPGPLLEANRGDTLRVNFTNDTDVEMTIHWHGLRVSPEMDGIMQMENPVQPGESFTYELVLPDAGFYWYHPHMDTDTLLERGLIGAILVHDPSEGAADCVLPSVLDDVLLDNKTFQIQPPQPDMAKLMGRFGNLLMLNGRHYRTISVESGQSLLLPLVNASNARFWDVYLEGHTMDVVGTDGGWLAEPYAVDHLVVSPGERWIVRIDLAGEPGSSVRLMNKRFQLHEDGASMVDVDPIGEEDHEVATVQFGDTPVSGTPWVQPTADVPTWTGATEVLGHHWVLDENMEQSTVSIDGTTYPNVPEVMVDANVETTFELENASEMHHPFHIHGNRFQVVDVGGEAIPAGQGWKDTFDIPPRTTVTLVSPLDNPGEWMYHCHILEHADDGMAGLMTVE